MSEEIVYFNVLSYVMIAIGQWNWKLQNPILRYVYQHVLPRILSLHLFIMTQLILLTVIVWKDCTSRFLEMISAYVQFLNVNVTFFVLRNSSKIQTILKYMVEYETKKPMDTKLKGIFVKNAKVNNVMVALIGALIISVTTYWCTVTVR